MGFYDESGSECTRDESYVNPSKHSMTASVYCPALTDEEIELSKEQIHEYMKGCREREEKARAGSVEAAKTFWAKAE